MTWGGPNIAVPTLLAIMYVDSMDDDVCNIVYGDAWSISNMDARTPAVDRLVRVHDQLLLKLDDHVPGEDDPQWFVLDDRMAEGPRLGVHRVIIGVVGDHVDPTVPASHRILAKPNCTVGEPLAVLVPVGVAPPAVVDGVASAA